MVGTANTDSWTASIMKSRWEYFDISRHGGHTSFFNPKSIRVLVKRSGFKIESVKTHSVRFLEKEDATPVFYRMAKIIAELMNLPSRVLGKGHDIFFRSFSYSVSLTPLVAFLIIPSSMPFMLRNSRLGCP